jgi:twitching motility protein PilU
MEVLDLLKLMTSKSASDLFITVGAPPSLKVDGQVLPVKTDVLTPESSQQLVNSLMSEAQRQQFETDKEANFAVNPEGLGRFRVNVFRQQGQAGMVVRRISAHIPTFEELNLPPAILEKIAMARRGLVLFVGGTGAGKSSTQAAMVGYRNHHTRGHIVTVEDPIEFVHAHDRCIRTPETIKSAIVFAETGHLCLATLHANNTYQALERIINLYPDEGRDHLYMDLSMNLKAIISQRLVPRVTGGGFVPAVEVMLNSPLVSDLILKGQIDNIRDAVEQSVDEGMMSFDQSLFDLFEKDLISYEDAMRSADSENNLRLKIKLEGKAAKGQKDLGSTFEQVEF